MRYARQTFRVKTGPAMSNETKQVFFPPFNKQMRKKGGHNLDKQRQLNGRGPWTTL
jgi:hypothetical protein